MTLPPTPSGSTPLRWVRQEDAEGCGVAVLAMLTDDTYANVVAGIKAWEWGKTLDLASGGITSMHFDRYLTERGYFIARRYDTWGMPMEPFADRHVALVRQPSGNNHFVAVDRDGIVFDPMHEGKGSLADRPVMHLVGVIRP